MEQLLPHPFVRLPDDYFSNLSFYLEIDGVRLEQFKRVVYVNDSAAILSLLRSTDVVRLGPGLSAPDFAEYGICKDAGGALPEKRGIRRFDGYNRLFRFVMTGL